jgi:hypothetical protein
MHVSTHMHVYIHTSTHTHNIYILHAIIYIQLYTYTINCDHTCLICNSLKPTSASYYKLKSFIFLWSRPIFHSQLLFSSVSIRRLTQRCWSCHNASSRMVQKTRPHVYGTHDHFDRFGTHFWPLAIWTAYPTAYIFLQGHCTSVHGNPKKDCRDARLFNYQPVILKVVQRCKLCRFWTPKPGIQPMSEQATNQKKANSQG